MGDTINQITTGQLMAIIAGLLVLHTFAKHFIFPFASKWLKIDKNANDLSELKCLPSRVDALERHEKANLKMIEENDVLNRLLCKAMIALIDNQITNNGIDNLKIVKSELIDYITKT